MEDEEIAALELVRPTLPHAYLMKKCLSASSPRVFRAACPYSLTPQPRGRQSLFCQGETESTALLVKALSFSGEGGELYRFTVDRCKIRMCPRECFSTFICKNRDIDLAQLVLDEHRSDPLFSITAGRLFTYALEVGWREGAELALPTVLEESSSIMADLRKAALADMDGAIDIAEAVLAQAKTLFRDLPVHDPHEWLAETKSDAAFDFAIRLLEKDRWDKEKDHCRLGFRLIMDALNVAVVGGNHGAVARCADFLLRRAAEDAPRVEEALAKARARADELGVADRLAFLTAVAADESESFAAVQHAIVQSSFDAAAFEELEKAVRDSKLDDKPLAEWAKNYERQKSYWLKEDVQNALSFAYSKKSLRSLAIVKDKFRLTDKDTGRRAAYYLDKGYQDETVGLTPEQMMNRILQIARNSESGDGLELMRLLARLPKTADVGPALAAAMKSNRMEIVRPLFKFAETDYTKAIEKLYPDVVAQIRCVS